MQEYTVAEAAKMLGVSPQTIRNWCNAGIMNVHHRTQGGFRRFHRKEIEEARQLSHAEVKGLCKKLA